MSDERREPPVFDLHPDAHRIASDAEALAAAHTLAEDSAAEAAERDREQRLPAAELDRFGLGPLGHHDPEGPWRGRGVLVFERHLHTSLTA